MTETGDTGFTEWSWLRLTEYRRHMERILFHATGQADRPEIKAEYDAVVAEIAKRTEETR